MDTGLEMGRFKDLPITLILVMFDTQKLGCPILYGVELKKI